MQLFMAALVFTAAFKWQPAESLEPLLESNEPPYTLINFALEEDPRVDQVGANLAQSRRREWLDTQFEHLKRKQRQNKEDDTRNINKALKSIRKELGVTQMREVKPKLPKPGDEDGDSTHVGNKLDAAKLNLKNKIHRSIWLAMKRRDKPQFMQLEKQIRATGVELDGVSYTLLVHATLLFHGPGDEAMALIKEMRERGIHPSLIRFNAVRCGDTKAVTKRSE
ncbi:hypothetical protein, conserved [Babesia ovata]|uniref:Uncharacterized protein n=1 Tax=Babesia ovata TaxID=189622 RepID=A0A2H6KAL8_9APIC|nr:uncharacterized protein BOVATA_015190 [Babesia ovata]GBE60026.1 hypothetical protein, conserved [Babesia ovata]